MNLWRILIGALCLISSNEAISLGSIKHVIVLMLENRSFDHLLGFLKQTNKEINGCLPNEEGCSNPMDPSVPESPTVTVDGEAVYVQASPSHSISGTTQQIYGYPTGTTPPEDALPLMNGFIKSYEKVTQPPESIMKCFVPDHVPIISTLASEFGVFDGWYASVPGPTMVNRAYANSGTSHGMGTNDEKTIAKGLPQKTMFKQLLDMGLDYRVYFQDVPSVLQHKDMRRKEARERYRLLDVLYSDLAAGTMPEFSWVEPAYFSTKKQPATDQHPDHDVGLGEQLIKDIYESVRSSPIWNETAFIVTYDEHGGFFDHVAPPVNVPNPDGLNATDDPFDFTRLGIRVPTVVISPWVKKGTIIHAPHDTTASQYDHTSLISTVVHKLFGPNEGFHIQPYLTDRDAWSKTFEWVFTTVESPRTDCPMELPSIYSQAAYVPPQDGTMLLTDLQQELIQIVAGAANDLNEHKNVNSWTEEQAATYIHDRMVELGILV